MQTKTILGVERLGIINKLRDYNTKKHRREPLSRSFKLKLRDSFKDDIYKLSRQINMDLSQWTD